MILNSLDKQLSLAEDGQISWQKDLTNPLPGEPVAIIVKGEGLLKPSCKLIDTSSVLDGQNLDEVQAFIQKWLQGYIATALEPLFKLKDEDIAEGAARDISAKLHEALGILPREDLQDLIAKMEEDQRATLRTKKIRFGPLLVYLPELNKPAMVRLRALLLSLWEDKDLPATVPADGIVSFSVIDQEIDKNYYRAIGYPVYGPRSIRVDMLDRVVCAVYDQAKDGKFMAQHQMAEWLGSNIADLYAVLEAMGHSKIYDPADEVKEEESASEEKFTEEKSEQLSTEEKKEGEPVVISTEKVEQVKPDLATFRLKKGKAITTAQNTAKPNKKFSDKKFSSDKKKFKGKKPDAKKPQGQRVYTAEAKTKPEDNPFAILEQLKTAKKD